MTTSVSMSVKNVNQFVGNPPSLSSSTFLGGGFTNLSGSAGGIANTSVGQYGAQVSLSNFSGKLGLDVGYSVNSGTVSASYSNVSLQQSYQAPTQFNQAVNFTPQNTFVSYQNGTFSTTSPSVGASINLDDSVSGTISAAAAFGGEVSASTSFSGSLSQPQQPLFSWDSTKGIEIFGQPLAAVTGTNGEVDGVKWGVQEGQSISIPIPLGDSGLSLTLTVTPNTSHTGLSEELDFDAGLNDFVAGGVSLGTASQSLPSISLNSSSLQSGGALADSKTSSFANLQLQMGPLVGAILGLPQAAVLGQDSVSVGPATLSFTPAGFAMGPQLSFAQTGSITPTNQLTYNFYEVVTAPTVNPPSVSSSGGSLGAGTYYYTVTSTTAAGESTASNEVSAITTGSTSAVTLSWNQAKDATGYKIYRGTSPGAENTLIATITSGSSLSFTDDGTEATSAASPPTSNTATTTIAASVNATVTGPSGTTTYTNTSSVPFTPGVDTLSVDFAGTPILVQPTWTYGMNYSNEVDLDGSLTGTLTAGELSGTISQLGTVKVGPLYTQTYDSPNLKLATLYNQSNNSIYQNSKQLPSFIIGGDFKPSLVVNTNGDGNTTYNPATGSNGTLRGAVESANLNYQNGTTGTQVIHLGPGTYTLTLPPSGNDGASSGDLNIASNLVIEGAGAGQTIIQGTSLDRIFNVGSGYSLALEGVTVQGGSANYGAGIYNAGTLTVNNSIVTDNSTNGGGGVNSLSVVGGGIDNAGTLTVNDSTISNNNSNYGAGIYNTGTLTISNSTISGNAAFSYGGIYSSGTLTVSNTTLAGNSGFDGTAGGIDIDAGTATILDSTISSNEALGGGGIYVNGASALLDNTIVSGNTGGDVRGTLSSNSSNNLIGGDPKLSLLGDYGGPTQTMELLPGSPAIDAGSNADAVDASGKPLTTDQRGDARIINGNVDIGAVEYQYDLGLNGAVVPGTAPGTVQYVYTVSNNGPDPAAGVTLTVPLPQGVAFQSLTNLASWNETDPGVGNNGTVTLLGNLNSGQTVSFIITAQLQNTAVGSILSNTATVGPDAWDNNLQNNSVTLTIANAQEGQAFNPVPLFHFTDPNTTGAANDFTASVGWGDGSSNSSNDGSSTVFVVTHPNGGFDVFGSHSYAEEGSYVLTVGVTGLDGTTINSSSQQLVAVADAPLTAVAFTPPPNATVNQPITNAVLYHFTDADPNGKASDYTAKVTWGDSTSNSSGDGSGNVSVVVDRAGGFDVIGSHTYTQILNPGTFQVQVSDSGGASVSASASNFQVLNPDQPLTAGALNVPSVSTEGQSISNQVLFHFSDADSNAQVSDYLAAVSWGDGTTSSSNDGSGSVSVVANPNGGFDVVGSHTYEEGSFYFAVKVTDMGDPHSTLIDGGGQFTGASSSTPLTITDPPVVVKAGSTFTVSQNTVSAVQTVATFTDPGGPESNLDPLAYVATIQWGDGTSSLATLTTQVNKNSQGQIVSGKSVPGIVLGSDGQTFSVNLAHQYANWGSYTITIQMNHEGVLSSPVTTTAIVAGNDNLTATGGSSITSAFGTGITNATVATFTDTNTANPASEFSATITWGDGQSSAGTISGSNGHFTVAGNHNYASVGSFPIGVTISNFGGTATATASTSATITQATPTLTVSDPSGAYNGQPFAATAKAVGVDGTTPVAGSFSFAYYAGTSDTPLSGPPINVGTYTVVATFTSSDSNYTSGGTVQTTFTISSATLTVTGASVNAIAGAPFSGTLATFTSSDPNAASADFTATITWGDDSTSSGVIGSGGGTFTVTGSHTYAAASTYTIQVTINPVLGNMNSATVNDPATVTNLGKNVQKHQTENADFWSDRPGQALIESFNGGPSSTALSTWLATTFPNLFGSGTGANNLTGTTNTQVAAFFESLVKHDHASVEGDVLATALNVYATTLSLGGTAGKAYGFDVSADGLGADSFNVGEDGAAFGVANRTTLNVYQLLLAANKQAVNGVLYNGNDNLQRQADRVFDALSQHRDE